MKLKNITHSETGDSEREKGGKWKNAQFTIEKDERSMTVFLKPLRKIILLIAVLLMSGCGWFPLPKCLKRNPPPMEPPKDYQDYEEMRYDYWRDKKIPGSLEVGLPQDYKDASAWQDDENQHR